MKLEPMLRAEFMAAVEAADRPASQIVRDFMRDFIQHQLNHFLRISQSGNKSGALLLTIQQFTIMARYCMATLCSF